ncbi:hypothetical protein [Sebaldella sp. S0638]|uniref:hypothetical protein n=1 Tax=Sebaldella sp. S0638 TaxID=2957809 RepID=UPI00209F6AEF|nr:hypothetical protein [Sebaldella sp. S0638]MCP1226543.1 hypothetical protein [Sebaldella sp. S0638]
MDIITKLKILLDTSIVSMDDEKYFDLVDSLGTSNENQEKFINYILHNDLSVENEYKVFMLLREVYGFEDEYDIELGKLYNWVLKIMFKKEFYDYSMCYRFSDLLVKMTKNDQKVYKDIIENVNIFNPLTVQIAICSMYGYYDYFQYKELTEIFLDKIFTSIKKNKDNQDIIKDFNRFMRRRIKIEDYKQYEVDFKMYAI